jgi:hypothetical protein
LKAKKTKAYFSTKAAGSIPPHTKAKSARAAFYGRVKQGPLAEALEALFYSCWGKSITLKFLHVCIYFIKIMLLKSNPII